MNDIAHDLCLGLAVVRARIAPYCRSELRDEDVGSAMVNFPIPIRGRPCQSSNPTSHSDCNATIQKPLLFGWANQSRLRQASS